MNWLFGGGINAVNSLAQTFVGNAAERETAAASDDAASESEYAGEFQGRIIKGTWWDSLWDGINRMPRPIMVFAIFYLFFDAYHNPENFSIVMTALAGVPQQLWNMLMLIVGFYLPSRMIEKVNMGKIDATTAALVNNQAQQVVNLKNQVKNSDVKVIEGLPWLNQNQTVAAWKAQQVPQQTSQ